jgi:hypothetical protein
MSDIEQRLKSLYADSQARIHLAGDVNIAGSSQKAQQQNMDAGVGMVGRAWPPNPVVGGGIQGRVKERLDAGRGHANNLAWLDELNYFLGKYPEIVRMLDLLEKLSNSGRD